MGKVFFIVGLVLAGLLPASTAMAACYAVPVPSTGAAYTGNAQQRIVCINTELNAQTQQQQLNRQVQDLDRRIDRLELQNRFDTLPTPATGLR